MCVYVTYNYICIYVYIHICIYTYNVCVLVGVLTRKLVSLGTAVNPRVAAMGPWLPQKIRTDSSHLPSKVKARASLDGFHRGSIAGWFIVEDPIPMELGLPTGNLHGLNWFMNVYDAKLDLDWI